MAASIEEQLAWSRSSALLVASPERKVVEVTGGDRLSWLNGLLTCQLAAAREGDAVLGLAVAQKGKIVSDVVVVVGEERVLLVIEAAAEATLGASFDRHLMMEDAEWKASSAGVWFVHGPRAGDVLARAKAHGVEGGALDVTGAGGAVLIAPREANGDVAAAARDAGGGVGDDAGWDVVRVLSGVPRFGVDFDSTTYPQEAALETKAVSFDKGCYLGQEVVCMLEMRGHVKRKLVSLDLGGDAAPSARAPVTDAAGATVGEITSAARTPAGEVRALAMVKYAFIARGTELSVDGHAARVV